MLPAVFQNMMILFFSKYPQRQEGTRLPSDLEGSLTVELYNPPALPNSFAYFLWFLIRGGKW